MHAIRSSKRPVVVVVVRLVVSTLFRNDTMTIPQPRRYVVELAMLLLVRTNGVNAVDLRQSRYDDSRGSTKIIDAEEVDTVKAGPITGARG